MEKRNNNIKGIKEIDIKEFRESGYLQEVNRRFFHPLGLALYTKLQESGEEVIGGLWDYREDKEGIYYDISNSEQERKDKFKLNEEFISDQLEERSKARIIELGFNIEPIK